MPGPPGLTGPIGLPGLTVSNPKNAVLGTGGVSDILYVTEINLL